VLELPWEQLELDPVIFFMVPTILFLNLPMAKTTQQQAKTWP
jgi:hypothetical protein